MSRRIDWLMALISQGRNSNEIDLSQIQPLDVLRVKTERSYYEFRIIQNRDASVKASSGKNYGMVRIMGCKYGNSSTIKPDSLFCGGNLEFTYQDGELTHTTTRITELTWDRIRD